MTKQFFASCAKGFEDILVHEFEQLGISSIRIANGGVHFEGEMEAAYKACLWSRVASRVLMKLSAFAIENDDDLYAAIQAVDWDEHMDVSNSFAIDCFSSHSTISNSHYATLRIKDALVDRFKEKTGIRPDVARERPDIRINVYLSDRECLCYLDLSGEALHMRGYRQTTGAAPLRETLAAAMLYRVKWREFAARGEALFDPMCGSATLLIEGAMIAADMAPGLLRDYYGFFGWKQFDETCWSQIHQQAEQGLAERIRKLPAIAGCDYSPDMLAIAQQNVAAAGFTDQIQLVLADSTQAIQNIPDGTGLLISNPPYGKRLGQIHQLRTLYLRLGKTLKRSFPGWTAAIFTSEKELAKSIGLRAFHKNTLYNGALKCMLYQYRINAVADDDARLTDAGAVDKPWAEAADRQAGNRAAPKAMPEKTKPAQVKPEQAATPVLNEHATMFVNRLRKNARHLKKWARKNNISCYRVYDADIPQYAVAIDMYENWVHVQEYEAPKTVDQAKAFQRLNDVVDVVAEILGVDQDKVVLKVRRKQSGNAQYQKQDQKDRKITVSESGLRFRVNLYDYLDTGLFLDHRKTRQLIRELAAGKDFLNLFAYTGSASVYAAAGGAVSTTTVDMSNTYIQWAEENLRINGYKGRAHRFIRADCLQWVWDAKRAGEKFDLIFLDPPTFSNSAKMQASFDIRRDHVELLKLVMRLLSQDGRLIFSTNARRFLLDDSLKADYAVKEITTMTVTEDFRRKPLHKCWCLAFDEKQLDFSAPG